MRSEQRKKARTRWLTAGGVLLAAATSVGLASAARPDATPNPNADAAAYVAPAGPGAMPGNWPALMEFPNSAGRVAVRTVGPPVDPTHEPFFRAIGPTGRACATCHLPENAMSLSGDTVRDHWARYGDKDPLFAAVDGSNCPNLPQDQESSHSLLLTRATFRISMPWPPKTVTGEPIKPEFTIQVLHDPTGCNTSSIYGLNSPDPHVSVYRRPRMVANLRYIEGLIHESNTKTMLPLDRDPETGQHVSMSLMSDNRVPTFRYQARSALRDHLQADGALSDADINKIVDFERRLYVAQNYSTDAGDLHGPGVPRALGVDAMRDGKDHINGNDRDSGVFFFFDEWTPQAGQTFATDAQRNTAAFKASVARGYNIFFYKPFWVTNVVGINNIRLGNPIKQTCAFCHDTQLTGQDDVPGWMDLGTENFPYADQAPDLPLFKITCDPQAAPHPYLGRVIYTHDPGRALVSGKCIDVGGIIMEPFRGIAARAPYFANGQAKSLRELVDFYDRRFNIGYTDQEKQDLINFLSVL